MSKQSEKNISFLIFNFVFFFTTFGFWWHWDFPFYDGADYFLMARNFAFYHQPLDAQWSPLYVMVYSLFHLFLPVKNPMLIYIVHRIVFLYLAAFLFWILANKLFTPILSLLFSALFIMNSQMLGAFHVIPVVRLIFVLIILLINVSRIKSKGFLIFCLSLFGYFIRPEFIIAVPFFAALLFGDIFRDKKNNFNKITLIYLIIFIFLLGFLVKNSFSPSGISRSFMAFFEQGFLSYQESGQYLEYFDGYALVQKLYGNVSSISEAFLVNPAEFLNHLRTNLFLLPGTLGKIILPIFIKDKIVYFFFLLIYIISIFELGPKNKTNFLFWMVLAIYFFIDLVTTMIFRPNIFYLTATIPFIYFGLTVLIQKIVFLNGEEKKTSFYLRVPNLVLLLIVIFVVFIGYQPFREKTERPVYKFCHLLLKDFKDIQPKNIFAWSPLTYQAFLETSGEKKCSVIVAPDLKSLLAKQKINVMIVSPKMRQYFNLQKIMVLEELEKQSEKFGFKEVARTSNNFVMYIKSSDRERLTTKHLR